MTTSDTEHRERVGPEDESREQQFAEAARAEGLPEQPREASPSEGSRWAEGAADADAARISELEAENSDVKDRLLRLAADMENLRRRTEREIKDARQFAVTNFARDMLSVSDNLDRALSALPEEVRASADAGIHALVEGVEMTARSMLTSLERHGVKKLEPKGERFDPNFHQAMFEVPDETVANNTVVQVVQDGYAIGGRVLRPALVGVSKGAAKNLLEPKPGVPDESSKDA